MNVDPETIRQHRILSAMMTQVQQERRRAHTKHRSSSMESMGLTDSRMAWVFLEELGEMADHMHESMRPTNPPVDQYQHLVKAWDEGIQAMTMLVVILDKVDQEMRRRRLERQPHPLTPLYKGGGDDE